MRTDGGMALPKLKANASNLGKTTTTASEHMLANSQHATFNREHQMRACGDAVGVLLQVASAPSATNTRCTCTQRATQVGTQPKMLAHGDAGTA